MNGYAERDIVTEESANAAMQATRQQILDYLRERGDATVKDLGRVLGLTPTGIRQHLTVLEQDGLVDSAEVRGRVGRPALRYSLTDAADVLYPKRYDDLAAALLEEVRATYGSEGLQRVVRGVAHRFAEEMRPEVPVAAPPQERVDAVARALRRREIVADWERDGDGWLLHERSCPYPAIARQNSVSCAMDVALVRELTGMDARLTECVVRGDSCCTYRLAPRPGDAAPASR